MGSTFNPQILVDKLAKLNMSQQSIETLSHWCIFHMNKAKLVVETWERQFHSSPREQRLAFLYLANDILQNSRRKGAEFVAEFWRVLPEALRDVIRNGDDFGRNAARRLISIWDERKVFGSRGHILKEEFMGKQPENNNRSGRPLSVKVKQSGGDMVDKIVSDYEAIYGGQSDEDVLLSKCSNAISGLEKVVKDVGSRVNAGQVNGSGLGEELQGKHAALRECIEQLTSLETSRAILVSHLREALQEQELKLDQLRSQLQAAQLQSEQAANLCQQFVGSDSRHDQGLKDAHRASSTTPPGFPSGDQRHSAPVIYKRQVPSVSDNKPVPSEDDSRKSTAAAVAAQLTASTASAEMLSHVLTSLVSGGIIDRSASKDSSAKDHQPSEKKPKLEEGNSPFTPPPPPPPPPSESQIPPPPLPPFPHPDSLQQNTSSTNQQQATPGEQQPPPPPPSSSPPPMPPLPPVLPPYHPMFLQSAGAMSNVSYTYGATQHMPPPPLPAAYTPVGPPFVAPPVNPYQNFQASEGAFYNPSSSVPMSSISHQQSL